MATVLETLYDTDFCEWAHSVAARLRAGEIEGLDLENIAEEIEDLGKRDRREVRSRLLSLLAHMLKWDYQRQLRSESWAATIREQRKQLKLIFGDSPSLVRHARSGIADLYRGAVEEASAETELAEDAFPRQCPYAWQDIFEREFRADEWRS